MSSIDSAVPGAMPCLQTVVPLPPALDIMKCHPIAMLHVHSGSALLNHNQTAALGVTIPTSEETRQTALLVSELEATYERFVQSPKMALIRQLGEPVRSVVFLTEEVSSVLAAFRKMVFVDALVKRAVEEAAIYSRNGIRAVELENVPAPYFIGPGTCPWEELVILQLAATAVREAHPELSIGVHILSCNELEVLPIAISVGSSFVRSEATLFEGLRPEGRTLNKGNLARFLYARRVLRQTFASTNVDLEYPTILSDVQKKHTVWSAELQPIDTWLHNMQFMKLEGVIVTGPETGSDVSKETLKAAREASDKCLATSQKALGRELKRLPIVTGSGSDFKLYCKYADYMIVGSAFKVNSFWENPVSEDNVKKVLEVIRSHQRS